MTFWRCCLCTCAGRLLITCNIGSCSLQTAVGVIHTGNVEHECTGVLFEVAEDELPAFDEREVGYTRSRLPAGGCPEVFSLTGTVFSGPWNRACGCRSRHSDVNSRFCLLCGLRSCPQPACFHGLRTANQPPLPRVLLSGFTPSTSRTLDAQSFPFRSPMSTSS